MLAGGDVESRGTSAPPLISLSVRVGDMVTTMGVEIWCT